MSKKQKIQNIYRLSPMQEGMLFHALLDKSSGAYVQQCVYTIKGTLDIALFEQSIQLIIDRYDVLRTVFAYENLDEPLQIVLKERRHKLYFEDKSHLEEEKQNRCIEEFKEKDRKQGFDLTKDMLLRFALFKTGPGLFKLVWTFHHIIMDGWCLNIIYTHLERFYTALTGGEPLELEPAAAYRDYIRWLGKQDRQRGLEVWREYLAGYWQPVSLPRRSGAGDKEGIKPGERKKYRQAEHNYILDETLTAGLTTLAAQYQVTLNTLCQTLWGILLQRYNNTDDVVFGAVVSGRPSEIPDIQQMVGLFVNTIPIRIKTTSPATLSFARLLNQTRQSSAPVKSHEYLPLADIQALTPLKNHLIDHLTVFQNYPQQDEINAPGLARDTGFRIVDVEGRDQTSYDLNLIFSPGKNLNIMFNFNSLVYDPLLIRNISLHLETVARQVLENPHIGVKDLEILSNEERKQLLIDFNNTPADYPEDKTLHWLFQQQVEKTPDHVALLGKEQLTYRVLDEKSHHLALLLKSKGITPDSIAAIMIEHSIEMIIGLLGILKAGAAYLPIDPGYPEERKKYMLADSAVKAVVTRGSPPEEANPDIEHISIETLEDFNYSFSHLLNFSSSRSTHLAYVIYTSGSTGQPKGVLLQHRGVVNTLLARKEIYNMDSRDTALQLFSYAFDGFVTSFFTPIISGARVVLLPAREIQDLTKIKTAIQDYQVSHFIVVPALFQALVENLTPEELAPLTVITLAGDRLPPNLIENAREKNKNLEIVNEYGVTEAAVMSTVFRFKNPEKEKKEKKENHVADIIGQPIKNTAIYILDRYHRVQPIGAAGEFCIAGAGLARGYLNNPGLTGSRFLMMMINIPRSCLTRKKIYKTGDLAQWLIDGNIRFLGRLDHQVKVRGFRIEPGEIEYVLACHKTVKQALVMTADNEDKTGDKYLCAYVVPVSLPLTGSVLPEHFLNIPGLKGYLQEMLPGYMVPAYIIPIEKIPLTPNGKIDRNALPQPGIKTGKGNGYQPPGSEVETKLAAIWSGILGKSSTDIGIHDNFFDLGGHSIKATILLSKIHKEFNLKIELADIFKYPTIRGLSGLLDLAPQEQYIQVEAMEEKEFYPLSYNQKRLWFINQLEPASPAYNMSGQIVLEHPVQEIHIKKALYKMAERHKSLKSGFNVIHDEPVQIIKKNITLPFKKLDLSSLDHQEKQSKIEDIFRQEVTTPFNLDEIPLFMTILIKKGENQYELIINMHHIITDGWSMEILRDEFIHIYEGYKTGKKFQPEPLKLQYKDFTLWHNKQIDDKEIKEKSHRFWTEKVKTGIPALKLPVDFKRKGYEKNERKARNGAGFRYMFDKEITTELRKIARSHNTSLFMVVFSLYILLLYRFSNQDDITCSIINAGRDHDSLSGIVGFFVNSLLHRIRVNYEETFTDFLRRVRVDVLEMFKHQAYPLELVFEDLDMKYPDISVSFNMFSLGKTARMESPDPYKPHHIPYSQDVKFDVEPYITEYRDSIHFYWTYDKTLFAPATIEYMVLEYAKLVDFFSRNLNKSYNDYKNSNKKRIIKRNN